VELEQNLTFRELPFVVELIALQWKPWWDGGMFWGGGCVRMRVRDQGEAL